MEPAVIVSERFDLRRWQPGDLAAFHLIWGDPNVVFWDPRAGEQERSREQLAHVVDDHARFDADATRPLGLGFFAVVDRGSGEVVGNAVLRPPPFDAPGLELGWHVRRAWWGRGVATESAGALIRHAVAHGWSLVFNAAILPDNLRSIAVARRLGMREAGTVEHAGLEHLRYLLQVESP